MKILNLLLVTTALLTYGIFAKVNPEEELVVKLTELKHFPLLQKALNRFTSSKNNQETIIPYVKPEQMLKDNSPELQNLAKFHLIETNADTQEKQKLQKYLLSLPFISASFIKPKFVNAVMKDTEFNFVNKEPLYKKSDTPNYEALQRYRNTAPNGVNCKAVENVPGHSGEGVTIYDIEQGFNFEHEDLKQHKGRVIIGTPRETSANHGVAVCSITSGYDNNFGVKGISYGSKAFGCSFWYQNSSHPRVGPAMAACLEHHKPGDIMVLEMHAIGPNRKFIHMAYWPDNQAVIKLAMKRGIIVIGAGGNGNENLDHPVYDRNPGFSEDWCNPFNRSVCNGAGIIVGAGAPDDGTFGPPRSRLDFSNYGSAVDVHGWGRNVVACGYGDLQRIEKNRWYTSRFSGTSSATPIVAGTLASIQGILRKRGYRMDSETARYILRNSGSPQQDHPQRPRSQRIGNLPNLKEMLNMIENDEYVRSKLIKL